MAPDELLDDKDDDGAALAGKPSSASCGSGSMVETSLPNKCQSASVFQSLLSGSQVFTESIGLVPKISSVTLLVGTIEKSSSDGGQELLDPILAIRTECYDTVVVGLTVFKDDVRR